MKHSFFLIFALFALVSCQKQHPLSASVHRVPNGFGYDIRLRGKILIRQENIPAIEENKAFCDSLDAIRTANRVIGKIMARQSPSISEQDLADLKIRTKC